MRNAQNPTTVYSERSKYESLELNEHFEKVENASSKQKYWTSKLLLQNKNIGPTNYCNIKVDQ